MKLNDSELTIFIGFSQLHITLFEENQNFTDIQANRILICSPKAKLKRSLWYKIIYAEDLALGIGKVHQLIYMMRKIKNYKSIVDQLNEFRHFKQPILIFSSLENILANYLFFNYSKDLRAIVIEDGILNYYNHSIKNLNGFEFNIKRFIANRYGLNFRKYAGHTTGIDYAKTLYQLIRFNDLNIKKSKPLYPTMQKRTIDTEESMFFIGQEPYRNKIGDQQYKKNLLKIAKSINNNNLTKLYYKPHRYGVSETPQSLSKIFPEKEIIICGDFCSAEDLYYEELKSKYLYSFDSSALFNIYFELSDFSRNNIIFTNMPIIDEIINLSKECNFRTIR